MFGNESHELWVEIEMQTTNRLRILIRDNKPSRFRVPMDIPSGGDKPLDPIYRVSFTSSPVFGVRVERKSTGMIIFKALNIREEHMDYKYHVNEREQEMHINYYI